MSKWAFKRQVSIFTILIIIFILFVYLIFSLLYNKEASCFDGIKNQGEKEIDCGRVCDKVCKNEIKPIHILWSRLIPDGDRYDVVTYLQNRNKEFTSRDVPYIFTFYDEKGSPIHKVSNTLTYLPPLTTSVVIEENILVSEDIPRSVFLEFRDVDWVYEKNEFDPRAISIKNEELLIESSTVEATVVNNTLKDISNINLFSIVFDENDNAIATTRSFIRTLQAKEERNTTFLWKNEFVGTEYKCSVPLDISILIISPEEFFTISALSVIQEKNEDADVLIIDKSGVIGYFNDIGDAKEILKAYQEGKEVEKINQPQEGVEGREVSFIFGTENEIQKLIELSKNTDEIPTYFFAFDKKFSESTQNIKAINKNVFLVNVGGKEEIENVYGIIKSNDCNAEPVRAEVIGIPEL